MAGKVSKILLQPDGKVLVAGVFPRKLLRLNADGSLDASFDAGTGPNNNGVSSMAVQPDGKIIVGGFFTTFDGVARDSIARLNADGSVDTAFDPSGGPDAIVRTLALQPDGRTLLGGDFTNVNNTQRNAAARLLGDYNLNDYPPLGQWRIVNFGSPNAADLAAPFGDGVTNLMKYALNLNARGPDATPMTATGTKGLPLAGRDGTSQYLTLTFIRRQAATSPGITYLVEFANGLMRGRICGEPGGGEYGHRPRLHLGARDGDRQRAAQPAARALCAPAGYRPLTGSVGVFRSLPRQYRTKDHRPENLYPGST